MKPLNLNISIDSADNGFHVEAHDYEWDEQVRHNSETIVDLAQWVAEQILKAETKRQAPKKAGAKK